MASSDIKKIFTLLLVFAGIALIGFATITMMAMQDVPDQNETPELYEDWEVQQEIQKPFLSGFQVLLIFLILALLGAGFVVFLKSLGGGRF